MVFDVFVIFLESNQLPRPYPSNYGHESSRHTTCQRTHYLFFGRSNVLVDVGESSFT